jgi:hypothetical protein
MVVHAYNPSTQEAEAGGSQVQRQPLLQSETMLQKQFNTFSHDKKKFNKLRIEGYFLSWIKGT